MHRFYTTCQNISQDIILISDKNHVHHIRNVLRLKTKEEVVIFDDKGNEYSSIIEKILPKSVIFKIKKRRKSFPQKNKLKITVACAIPKKSKMDEIIDKLTQLGVDRIIPLETQRVVIRLDEHKKILRHRRWEKIAQNASLQSQRSQIPVVEPIKDIRKVLSCAQDFDLKLIPTLMGKRKTLRETLRESNPKNILVLIGPEGDFTPQEVDSAKRVGFIPVSLGDLVLRVETAALAVASFIRLYENS